MYVLDYGKRTRSCTWQVSSRLPTTVQRVHGCTHKTCKVHSQGPVYVVLYTLTVFLFFSRANGGTTSLFEIQLSHEPRHYSPPRHNRLRFIRRKEPSTIQQETPESSLSLSLQMPQRLSAGVIVCAKEVNTAFS